MRPVVRGASLNIGFLRSRLAQVLKLKSMPLKNSFNQPLVRKTLTLIRNPEPTPEDLVVRCQAYRLVGLKRVVCHRRGLLPQLQLLAQVHGLLSTFHVPFKDPRLPVTSPPRLKVYEPAGALKLDSVAPKPENLAAQPKVER